MSEAGSGTSRNRSVSRRPEEEVIERRGPGRAQAADLLSRFRRPTEPPAPALPPTPAGGVTDDGRTATDGPHPPAAAPGTAPPSTRWPPP
ncbi:hypothetical protein StrepF001_29755 [Streptomyces sp. F001]|uniref:hypothetical protein n=1 Tax=Streptomyces sp. F001 TaxID=1510026 RepID=UPI00101E3B66|nr:hypothetical protein [Streptomyces sp. F001]RZB15934.1 hypothetical protein StrepF001_29755 [Streptomyces sp. F001]